MIFANCVSLALYRPAQGEDSPHNETLSTLELSLNVFFTLELLLRYVLGLSQIQAHCLPMQD
jgi:hypothetical protein|tara:strand:- start:1270 stop:1455 length:186 start_codon:yes stop_codon:yes gene_type:complete